MFKKFVAVVLITYIGFLGVYPNNKMVVFAETDKIYSTEKVVKEKGYPRESGKIYSTERVVVEEVYPKRGYVEEVVIRERNSYGAHYNLSAGLGIIIAIAVIGACCFLPYVPIPIDVPVGRSVYYNIYEPFSSTVKRSVVERVCEVCNCATRWSSNCCVSKCFNYDIFGNKRVRVI